MNFFEKIINFGFLLNPDLSVNPNTRSVLLAIGVLLSMAIAYLLGSINFAIIISEKKYNEDIRTFGSKNAGMTNMVRTYGKKAGALTLLGDALKAAVAAVVGYLLVGYLGAYVAGLFCVIGHMFPIFHHFRGGKGVVTVAVSILMCDPLVFAILFLMFVIIVLGTKYISLGSVMCMLLYPLLVDRISRALTGQPSHGFIFALLMAILVIAKHHENISRLLQGKERKFSLKKKSKTEAEPVAEESVQETEAPQEEIPESKITKKKNPRANYGKKKK